MKRSRMFDDEAPERAGTPSPRTTIVGGRPPEEGASLPPVPTGIQRLLYLAAADEAFRRVLCERRAGAAEAAGVELTASEAAILGAVTDAQLEAMIASIPPPPVERRSFLRETAASAVLALGGAALATTCTASCTRGATADVPAQKPGLPNAGATAEPPPPSRPTHRETETEGGAAPHPPPPPRPTHRETETEGGAAPHPPPPPPAEGSAEPARALERLGASGGGAAPDTPPPREERRMPAPGGAAPDHPRPKPKPKPKPDAGTK
jgi:hypothetical protein